VDAVTTIPLAKADRKRTVLRTPDVLLRNRFIEPNPVLATAQCYTARPGLTRWISLGTEFIRALFHAPGTFGDDHFVVYGDTLARVTTFGVPTVINTALFGSDVGSDVSMCCTGDIGDIPPFLWYADGQTLWVYMENGWARGTLSSTGNPANGDVVRIDTVYYQFTTGSVDAGTPAGTLANPWLVAQGISAAVSLNNLWRAVNDTGTPGTEYSTALTPHTTVSASSVTANSMTVRAYNFGTAGNAIVTTETSANLSWGAATLTLGGTPATVPVIMPGDYAPISVGFINGFVIVIPAADQGVNGRFYWIEPGETTVDPLNFATAERSPDPVYQVVVFGDQFWLPGQNTTEPWFMTGDPDTPMLRVQGVLFDRGTIPGTALPVKDSMIIVDSDGGVFRIKGGVERISSPDIEERIRKAIARQNFLNP
jgi:hypothetical protein